MAKECTTLTLADLADTSGWQEPAEPHKIYGLELNDRGYYARTPVASEKYVDDRVEGAKTMKGGIDLAGNPLTGLGPPVGASDAVPKEYVDGPAWDVRIELRGGYVQTGAPIHVGSSGRPLRPVPGGIISVSNMGAMAVTFYPHFSSGRVAYSRLTTWGCPLYGITLDNYAATEGKYHLEAGCPCDADYEELYRPPVGAVIYLELVIKSLEQKEAVVVLSGVKIKWGASQGNRRLGLVLTRGTNGWTARATEQDITIELAEVDLSRIPITPACWFVRLLYSSKTVPSAHIDRLISQLKD